MSPEDARRLLDYLWVPHRLGKATDAVIVHLCRGCTSFQGQPHSAACPIAESLAALYALAYPDP